MRLLGSVAVAIAAIWAVLVVALVVSRPRGTSLSDALRLLPDTLGLLRRLATDKALDRGARVRLWLLFAYLALPFDIVPDFIPVIGHADDVIIVCLVLRSVVRRAGAAAVRRNWPGTPEGLAALWRIAGLPGTPSEAAGSD